MSQPVRDLPDPLEPAPALAASSPDDLLAKMADEAIDKLMAAADKGAGTAVAAPPPPMDAVADEPLLAEPPVAASTEASTVAATPAAVTVAEPGLPGESQPSTGQAAVNPSPGAVEGARTAASDTPPNPAADVKALLEDAPAAPSMLLLPLRLLNAPFAWISDGARRAFGLIGLVTLVPAVCAIVYVIYLKRH